jgi:hypothetical protein
MAEIIPFREIVRARRRQREQEYLYRCVAVLEASLRGQVDDFANAPTEEWAVRSTKIRKLSEVLEYTTGLL